LNDAPSGQHRPAEKIDAIKRDSRAHRQHNVFRHAKADDAEFVLSNLISKDLGLWVRAWSRIT